MHSIKADLHTHSLASDGSLSPEDLLLRAIDNDVQLFALTDHDTVDGVKHLLNELRRQSLLAKQCVNAGCEFVTGIELSALYEKLTIHIVGLWVDVESEELKALIEKQALSREIRAVEIARLLEKQGFNGALEGAKQIAGDVALNRPHFARFLVANGYCKSEQQAFQKWLGRGKMGDVPTEWAAMDEVISTIHAAKGLAVLAHPYKYALSATKLRELIKAFSDLGGDALELVNGAQQKVQTNELLRLSEKYDLLCSTGSDFHGPEQVWCDVGGQALLPTSASVIWGSKAQLKPTVNSAK